MITGRAGEVRLRSKNGSRYEIKIAEKIIQRLLPNFIPSCFKLYFPLIFSLFLFREKKSNFNSYSIEGG
jgi:hypothetical protein